MGLYTESSMELLCQQVVRDNPELAGKITPDAVGVRGVPIAGQFTGRNTQITLVGKPGKGIIGEITVYYDRLNLTGMLRADPVTLQISRTANTHAELLPSFNDLYGLNLQPEDITTPTTDLKDFATAETLTLTIHATSLCYTGTVKLRYQYAPLAVYPNSGPGTKGLMAGDEQAGYFGVVEQAELFSGFDMVYALYHGTADPHLYSFKWLKFFLNGEVVFVPGRSPCAVPWQDIYNNGAVYDSGDAGRRPSAISADVEQLLYMSKQDGTTTHYFRLAMPFYTQDANLPNWAAPPSPTSIFSLLNKFGINGSYGEWGSLSGSDFMPSDSVWTRHHDGGDRVYYQSIDKNYTSYTNVRTASGWLPVLRLIDLSQEVVPLVDEGTALTWAAKVVTITSVEQPTQVSVVAVTEMNAGDAPRPLQLSTDNVDRRFTVAVNSFASDAPHPVLMNSDHEGRVYTVSVIGQDSVAIKPIRLTTEQSTAPTKINLAALNGELSGFN